MKRLSTYLRTGESLPILLGYWLPELIILCITTALPPLVDSYFVSHLHSATSYGALGMATNFLHTLVKLSEAIPVAAIAIIGRHNGARNLEAAGRHFMHTLGAAFLLGTGQLILVNAGAHHIYQWLGVPSDMALIGAPFLKLRSVSVLLAFILLALLGFMRAIKNTTTPMFIMIGGSALYILASAILIRGWGPFPAYGLYGPAIAALPIVRWPSASHWRVARHARWRGPGRLQYRAGRPARCPGLAPRRAGSGSCHLGDS